MYNQLPKSWQKVLWKSKINLSQIESFLDSEEKTGVEIYPPRSKIFEAYAKTDLEELKVVILGQDPYHGVGQAHGLAFSVPEGVKIPPSLRNMFKEVQADCPDGATANMFSEQNQAISGSLVRRAQQGVFLLNTILTVEAHQAASHRKIGREEFTDETIKAISAHKSEVVFLLRGGYAKTKIPLIDSTKHYVLTAPHPSPLSSYRGFFGCRHFSETNNLLSSNGKEVIDR